MRTPKLSDTARSVLTAASAHPDQVAIAPGRLPAAAQRAVMQSLLKAGVLDEIEAEDNKLTFRINKAGLQVITPALSIACDTNLLDLQAKRAVMPRENLSVDNMTAPPRPALRVAAQVLLEVWDRNPAPERPDLDESIAALRTALPGSVRILFKTPSQPRPDTKRALVLGLLRTPEGVTIAQVAEATGWARHTVHGFFAGLKKQGIQIEVLDRIRQVGAGQGAKGSYTVYRIGEVR